MYRGGWAARTSDVGKVWIELTYAKRLSPIEVWVYENCAPGAAYQVTGFVDGKEILLWRGVDPTPRNVPKGISKIKVKTKAKLDRIRVYLDCKKVTGWNEIDAVGLIDSQGKVHWAAQATASSTYADVIAESPATSIVWSRQLGAQSYPAYEQRIQNLEQQVRQLRQEMDKLRGMVTGNKGTPVINLIGPENPSIIHEDPGAGAILLPPDTE